MKVWRYGSKPKDKIKLFVADRARAIVQKLYPNNRVMLEIGKRGNSKDTDKDTK